ncbi:MAG: thioredoxin family protein [Gammaproteobacteria bacterium]|nr:thioredoxin family protein [Gammaproteobacteria bacterium]MCW8841607.1 thioredoxin family protein [Gammaproteobacteria bacterium]MCW8927755.1 thioredoxin family protein [Gammaproteobacteria bacterium]MCW8959239.1 thioredoxin family protein [Gammaproteobacteria bacterium]MCW8972232.1 thioredoxin family protein [Gammaproteobacteria bacterium]
MYKKIVMLLFAALALNTAVLAAEGPRDPYTYFFNETFGDYAEEIETARDEGKKGVMIFFEMDECPFCHWMKQNVLNQPEIQAYYREHFLMFPVDIEGDVQVTNFKGETKAQKEFAFNEFRVRATPVIAFFDLDGNMVHRHTGKTSDVEEFLLMGRFVAEEHYKKTRFVRFKREHRD